MQHEIAPFGVAAGEGVQVLFDDCLHTPCQALMLVVPFPSQVSSVFSFSVRREQMSQLTFETVEPSAHLSVLLLACFDRLLQ
ncbi:hypothetical protein AB0918_29710 [Streptomyces sp. NPDC006864]|uniref:hypothetical protein n=1 Tax=Streptomyces sp. NPDC006864 TaxID=3154780 RepID=UPI003452A7E6